MKNSTKKTVKPQTKELELLNRRKFVQQAAMGTILAFGVGLASKADARAIAAADSGSGA